MSPITLSVFTAGQLNAVTGKGFDLVDSGDLEGAVGLFRALLTLLPEDASIHAALGSVLQEQGNLHDAEKAYDAAIALEPGTVLARVNRGDLRCRRGDLAGGVEDLKVAAARPNPVQQRARGLLNRYAA